MAATQTSSQTEKYGRRKVITTDSFRGTLFSATSPCLTPVTVAAGRSVTVTVFEPDLGVGVADPLTIYGPMIEIHPLGAQIVPFGQHPPAVSAEHSKVL
jgi:hypothetical protein